MVSWTFSTFAFISQIILHLLNSAVQTFDRKMNDFVDCYQDIDSSDAFKDYLKKMVFKTLDFYYDYYQCERGMFGPFCSVRMYSE